MEIYFDGTLINSDNYISFTNEFKQFDESFMLGTTVSNTITIEVPGNIVIPTNVLIKINNSNYSTMIVDSYEYEDNNILKLNLVDKMVLLDFNYNAKPIVPCTVKQILQDICNKAGITLATTTFTNQNLSVDFYDSTITAREYVGMIAELNGGFARINISGALELVKFTGTPTNIDIDTCEDFRVGEKHKIERVVFDNGLLKFETSSDETKETLYLNSQNVYINDETTFNNIANQILNFEFYCFSTGNCEIKSNVRAGDLINFTDGTNNYPTIAQYSLNYVGGLNGGYELSINSQRQEETKIVGLGEQYKKLRVELNRDENQLSILAGKTETIEKEINPTDTSSGSSIYLEDSAESELIDFELEGKTTQDGEPTPDNPSEMVSVGYENLANTLLGTLTNNGITATIESDIITINGTATANSFIYLTPYLSLKSGSYNISVNNKEIIQGTENYFRLTYSSSGTEITSSKAYLNNLDAKKSFTIEERNDYRLQLRTNSGTTYNNFVIKLQLEKGSQTHSYIPYGKYGIEIQTTGKNLFNKDNYLSGYFEGNESTIIASSNRNAVFYIKIDKNTNYNLHLSSYNNLSQIRVGSTDTLPNSGVIVYNVKVFNYTNKNLIYNSGNYNYIVIRIQTNAGYTITPNNINDIITEFQVEKGNVFTDYEEYKSNTYLYTLDQPLRSNIDGTIKDLLYIRNGMLYVDRYIRNLNLAIADMNNGEDYPGWTNLTQLKNDYPGLNSSFTNANISYQSNIGNQRQKYSLNTRATGTLWFPKSQWNDMTQTDWKSSYPDLVFDFNYALSEPYTEELGTIQIPSTYEGITHIDITDNLEPNMAIIYVRNLPLTNYVESHYAELKIKEDGIETRVESIENNGYGDRITAVETAQTSTDLKVNVISTNSGIELDYDSQGKPISGKVREVTTTTGFTFNAEGMTIEDTSSNFKAQHRNTGTYYKEGDTIVGQYTKDGSKQKDLELFGVYYYGKNDFPDTPMFVAQLYTDGNGEECFGHFYNRGD